MEKQTYLILRIAEPATESYDPFRHYDRDLEASPKGVTAPDYHLETQVLDAQDGGRPATTGRWRPSRNPYPCA